MMQRKMKIELPNKSLRCALHILHKAVELEEIHLRVLHDLKPGDIEEKNQCNTMQCLCHNFLYHGVNHWAVSKNAVGNATLKRKTEKTDIQHLLNFIRQETPGEDAVFDAIQKDVDEDKLRSFVEVWAALNKNVNQLECSQQESGPPVTRLFLNTALKRLADEIHNNLRLPAAFLFYPTILSTENCTNNRVTVIRFENFIEDSCDYQNIQAYWKRNVIEKSSELRRSQWLGPYINDQSFKPSERSYLSPIRSIMNTSLESKEPAPALVNGGVSDDSPVSPKKSERRLLEGLIASPSPDNIQPPQEQIMEKLPSLNTNTL